MNGVVTATVWQHASELFFSMFRAVETLAVRSPIDSWSLCLQSASSGKLRAKTSSQKHHLACIVCKHNLVVVTTVCLEFLRAANLRSTFPAIPWLLPGTSCGRRVRPAVFRTSVSESLLGSTI